MYEAHLSTESVSHIPTSPPLRAVGGLQGPDLCKTGIIYRSMLRRWKLLVWLFRNKTQSITLSPVYLKRSSSGRWKMSFQPTISKFGPESPKTPLVPVKYPCLGRPVKLFDVNSTRQVWMMRNAEHNLKNSILIQTWKWNHDSLSLFSWVHSDCTEGPTNMATYHKTYLSQNSGDGSWMDLQEGQSTKTCTKATKQWIKTLYIWVYRTDLKVSRAQSCRKPEEELKF